MKRCAKCCCPVSSYAMKRLSKEQEQEEKEKVDEEMWSVLDSLKEREKNSIMR